MVRRDQMHGARYGEVLLVSGRWFRFEALVYNTLGLNDCPGYLWQELDPQQIKKEHQARAVNFMQPPV